MNQENGIRAGIAIATISFITACATTSDTPPEQGASEKPSQAGPVAPKRPMPRQLSSNSLDETPEEYDSNVWKKIATKADQSRLYQWIDALNAGQFGAVRAGEGEKVADPLGLFGINAVSGNSDIPEGLYNCAITKLGGPGGKRLPFIAYPAFKCRVKEEGGRKHFTKMTGSQRTVGWIYPASKRHSIYLGTLFYGYEDKAVPYGQSKERDQAAVLQRIGKDRWRMVFPWPYYESVVDVMELTPIK